MFRNYLSITLRQIKKNKSYIFINTFGLGVALACCVTSYLLLAFNIEFDSHLDKEKLADLYRVHTQFKHGEFGEPATNLVTPMAMGPAVFNDIAGVTSYSRYSLDGGFVRYGDKTFNEGMAFADSGFVNLIPLEVVKGELSSFGKVNTVILSKQTSEKYFVDENPIGQVLTMNFANQTEIQVVVGAVVEGFPANSSISFDFLMRIDHILDIYNIGSGNWGDWRDVSLLLSIPNVEAATSVEKQLSNYVSIRNEKKEDAKVSGFRIEPFTKSVNQDDVNWSYFNLRMSIVPLVVFVSMAGIILLIACFNLTNTSVALAAKRFKEVGVRKVAGATKWQIVTQFLFEMVVIVLLALVVGLAVSKVLVAEFVDMWNLPYGLSDLNGVNLVIALIVLVFIASILAGIYPALMSTKFQPIMLIKNQAKMKGSTWFTKTLVTIQFSLSIIVLINGIVFTQNTKFQETLTYGFNYKNIMAIFIQDESEYKILKASSGTNPKVQGTAVTHHQLGMSSYGFPIKVDTTEYQVQHIEFGENFFEVMGLALNAGRFPNIESKTDEFETIVVNRTFLDKTGIVEPLNSIVSVREERRRIIGVVEDHIDGVFRSKEPEPFVYYAAKRYNYGAMLVMTDPADQAEVRDAMEEVWKEAYPERPFQSQFQEELLFGNIRNLNTNMKKIFIFLTILGGLLSVAGIYALASLNVERRTKEIGIRKVLGGSVQGIVGLLSKQFLIILSVSGVIGGVAGYFQTDLLLDEIYAYHIEIKVLAVIFGVLAVGVAGLLTTTSTILRAAQSDPVKSLRDE